MKKIKYYFRIWWLLTKNSFLTVTNNRFGTGIFLVGKIIRFFFFFFFLVFLLGGTKTLVGYNLNEVIIFYLTFNLIDTVSQFLFRGVYQFRRQIVTGNFDLVLTKPVSPLFRSLFGGADIIDLMTIPFLVMAVVIFGLRLDPNFGQTLGYLLLMINGLILAAAFHIAVLALGIVTLEIDHTIMIYRDFSSLGRLPVDIYREPLKSILTFFVPVGVMMTFPAKALMGLISFWGILWCLGLGFIALALSLKFWRFALTKYTSASS